MVASAGFVDIDVGLDLRRFHRQLRQVNAEMRRFEASAKSNFGQGTESIKTMDRATNKASRSFIGLAGNIKLVATALGALALYGGTRAFAGFEASMNSVQAITDANISQFSLLNQKAQELGATTKFTASDVADAMRFMAMAGLQVNEIYGGVGATLKLAAAGNLDLAQSADIVTNIITSMGLTTGDLNKAVDVLANAFVTTNTDLVQLGYAFKYAAPQASIAGVSFEETAAALGLMGNAGVQGTLAGTSLRNSIQRLLGPTPQAAKVMKRLGLEVFDSTGKMKSLVDIVRQLEPVVRKGAASVDDLVTIFGVRAFTGMAALVKQGADALEVEIGKVERLGTAGKVADVQMRGLSGAFKELTAAAEALAISIGESGLGKAFEYTTRAAANTLRVIDQWVRATAPLQEQAANTLKKSYSELSEELAKVDEKIAKFQSGDTSGTFLGFLGDTEATVVQLKRRREEIVKQLEPMGEFIRLQRQMAETGRQFRTAVEQVDPDAGDGLPPGFGQFDEAASKRAQALQKLQALESEYLHSTEQNRRLIEVEYQRELDNFQKLLDAKLISQKEFEEARAQLTILAAQRMDELNKKSMETFNTIAQSISSNLEGAFRDFVENGKIDFGELARKILADIAVIALRMAILRPLLGGGGSSGIVGSIVGSILHQGGTAGSSGSKREVPAALFIGAPRLHNGGKLLGRDEVPAILQRGEEVVKKGQRAFEAVQRVANVNISINTPNPQAFQQSRVQVASQIAKAVALGQRGL